MCCTDKWGFGRHYGDVWGPLGAQGLLVLFGLHFLVSPVAPSCLFLLMIVASRLPKVEALMHFELRVGFFLFIDSCIDKF